jgi:prepilin peptidase CpaA
MVVTVLLLGLLAAASVTDACRHRIPNWLTYGGILAAWALNAVGTALVAWAGADPKGMESLGFVGIAESFFGFLVCGSVLLVCFVFFKVGGGDVKLMAMLGAFLGPQQGIEAMLWTFVLGACMGLIVLIWRVGPWALAVRVLRQVLWTARLRSWAPLSDEERAQLETRLFLAPSALAGAVIVRFSLVGIVTKWISG